MRHFDLDHVDDAANVLRGGGVLAYPTEAVFGLGCDPRNHAACARLFALKQRPPGQGVLLIGATFHDVAPYIDADPVPAATLKTIRGDWPGPQTWIFPRVRDAPPWIVGTHAGIAVRVTAHPAAAALCRAFGGALVSTSANRHGQAPARSAGELEAAFGDQLDGVLDGAMGELAQPTPIRDALSGAMIRT